MPHAHGAQDVLFLCRDNAALGPMAEALLNHWGRGRFRALSAGWRPGPGVHAVTLRVLRRGPDRPPLRHHAALERRDRPEAPVFRCVVLLGHEMPDEAPPAFKGDPLLARWQVADPGTVDGPLESRERAFQRAFDDIEARVKVFAGLALDGLDRLAAERRLAEIETALAAQSGPLR